MLENGKKYDVRNVGVYALESLRIEQGLPAWGSELNPLDLPKNTGLGSFVDLSKVSTSTIKLAINQERFLPCHVSSR